MSEPERLRPEQTAHVGRSIAELAGNVAARRSLPSRFLAFMHDDIIGARFFAFVNVALVEEADVVTTNVSFVGGGFHELAQEVPTLEVIDFLLEQLHDFPIVCDTKIADELSKHSLTWIEEDHYRLEGRPSGVIEVYTPYKAHQLPNDDSPPDDKKSRYVFEE